MKNKPMGKKVAVTSIIFCILLIVGIVLSMTSGVNTKDITVRNAVVTFEGSIKSSDLSTALREDFDDDDAAFVLNEVSLAEPTDAATTDENGETDTTTTTTAASGTFTSGKMIITITGVEDKTDDDIKASFTKVFENDTYKDNKLTIASINTVSKIGGFEPIQVYLCIIVLLVAFVYCIIRFSATGSLAAGVSTVVACVISAAVTVCLSLACGVFAGSNVSVMAGVTVAMTFVFAHIVLDGVISDGKCLTSTVVCVAAIVFFLLVLVSVVAVIAGDSAMLGYTVPGMLACVFSAVSALVYVKAIWYAIAGNNNNNVKTKKKKAVIK